MAIIKTFSCLVIFLKILACVSQLHNTNPKLILGKNEEYFDRTDHYSSSMEISDEVESSIEIENQEPADHSLTSTNHFSSTEENESEYQAENPILNRIKRRIFPGVGKALDRDRGGRNPWIRGRDSFDEPQRVATGFRRSGPMGSDLLYELYPDLAPPDWSDAHRPYEEESLDGIIPSHDTIEESEAALLAAHEDEIRRMEKARWNRKKKERAAENHEALAKTIPKKKVDDNYTYGTTSYHSGQPVRSVKKYTKSKGKIPKQLKEDIAKYAEEHGVNQALSYYKEKVDFPLRRGAVEKFVRRYKRRLERQRLRKLIKS